MKSLITVIALGLILLQNLSITTISYLENLAREVRHDQSVDQVRSQDLPSSFKKDILGQIPLSFYHNLGQSDSSVAFQVQTLGGSLFFTQQEVTFVLTNAVQKESKKDLEKDKDKDKDGEKGTVDLSLLPPTILKVRYVSANLTPEIAGVEPLPGVVNYLLGNQAEGWFSNIPTYQGIVYRELYPGIDLHFEGNQGTLKSVFHLAPGSDPALIQWLYSGSRAIHLDDAGNLMIQLPAVEEGKSGGKLIDQAPIAWQEVDGENISIPVHYSIDPDQNVHFVFPEGYDPAYPLIIDPELSYSSYLGGANNDSGLGITLDPDGNIFITGEAVSNNFPTVNPIMGNQPGNDVFVSKLNPAGTSLLYSTYLGGQYSETGHGIALDGAGHIVLVGETESANFPVVNGYQTTHGGGTCPDSEPCDDIFVTQLSADGSTILYSTFLGGNQEDDGLGLALDASGYVYITGYANSSTFPMVNALDSSFGGGTCDSRPCPDAIVAKLNPTASGSASLLYSTFLGAADNDKGQSIAVDSAGHAYVVGTTRSTIPTQTPWQASRAGGRDAFLVKLNPAASGSASKLYGTYLGGSTDDYGYAVALNGVNQVYLAGYTRSTNFPMANAYDNSLAVGTCGSRNCYDAFVAHFNLSNNSLVYSTYLGGTGEEEGSGLAVDAVGSAYLVGYSKSSDFPVLEAVQASKGADGCSTPPCADAIVTKFSPSGNELMYSTYLGGSNNDYGAGIMLDAGGSAYFTGWTLSTNFPTVTGAFDRTLDTSYNDAFVAKISSAGAGPALNWMAEGGYEHGYFGWSVNPAGDVNGDGFQDVLLGAPSYSNGESKEGAVFSYYGSASGLGSTANWSIESNQVNWRLGWSVSPAGDVNGDGYDDVIVSALGCSNPEKNEGCAALYLGSANGLNTTPAWSMEGNQSHAAQGYLVGTAGDVNNDGYSDVFVAAPDFTVGQTRGGRVQVYYGSSSGLSATPAWEMTGSHTGALFGLAASAAGDVNNDGFDDLLVGAPGFTNTLDGQGKVYLYSGSSSGLSTTAAWSMEGDQAQGHFGEALSAGDVNGDGYSDVAVGAGDYDRGEVDEGAVFVYLGSAAGLSTASDWIGESNQAGASFGVSVSMGGDINGDNIADLIVGANRYSNGEQNEGKVSLYYGSSTGFSATSDWEMEGDQAYANFGYAVAMAGDVNGDGVDGFLVGTPQMDDEQAIDVGRVHLFAQE